MDRRNQAVPIVSFVAARSGTGKTTLLEKVIAEMRARGLRVATMKHVHQASFDLPGKDSWRHRQAGAEAVCLVSDTELLLVGEKGDGADPAALRSFLPPVDFILVEGFKQACLPKVEVVRGEMGSEIGSPPEQLLAVATDLPRLEVAVPCFSLNEPKPLVDFLLKRFGAKPASERRSPEMTHFDGSGRARMVDVSAKESTLRVAVARGEIRMQPETLVRIKEGRMKKGDVLAVAQVAAVMAVKETPRLIPMCHPLNIAGVSINFRLDEAESKIEVEVEVKLKGQTGVEMEALTGVSIAALTIYDMCKAVDRQMEIGGIYLLEKSGGRSGHYRREE